MVIWFVLSYGVIVCKVCYKLFVLSCLNSRKIIVVLGIKGYIIWFYFFEGYLFGGLEV